jgi:hypothetical protein
MGLGKHGPNTPMCRKSNAGKALLFSLRSLNQREKLPMNVAGTALPDELRRASGVSQQGRSEPPRPASGKEKGAASEAV